MKLFTSIRNQISAFVKSEEGASAIEYAVIAGLIAVVVIGGATTLGTDISQMFTNIASSLPDGNAAGGGSGTP